MERTIKDYATHLDDCNINKDWSEAFDAMADTPTQFRDFAFDQAYQELKTKSMTCTCGLEQLLASQPSEQKQLSSGDQFPPFRKFTFENSDQSTIATDNTLPPEDASKGAETAQEFLIRITGISKDSLRVDFHDREHPNHLFNSEQVISFMQEFAQQSRQQTVNEALDCFESVFMIEPVPANILLIMEAFKQGFQKLQTLKHNP